MCSSDLLPPAFGTIGFGFDFTIEQRGGVYRPDSTSLKPDPKELLNPSFIYNKTPVNFVDFEERRQPTQILVTQPCDFEILNYGFSNGAVSGFGRPIYGSFNNGPAEYRITFEPGGTETMELKWGTGATISRNTFNVPYLNIKVENVIKGKRPATPGSFDSVEVAYTVPIEHINIDTVTGTYYPTPLSVADKYKDFVTGFNIAAHGWANGRTLRPTQLNLKKMQTTWNSGPLSAYEDTYIGTQGRYYLSAYSVDGKDTLDFTNIFWGSGVQFVFDYANKGRRFAAVKLYEPIPQEQYVYGEDFKAGDVITLKTTGGALGFPLPGAKVRCIVSPHSVAEDQIQDSHLDQIKIVPNPYYVSHQAQRSPYDAKIYFTKLPKKCTIEIYTLAGDKVVTLDHDGSSNNPEELAVEVWDLLTKNRQRVQSQTLVALITTPNGAQTVKNFTVVVGGFRLVNE